MFDGAEEWIVAQLDSLGQKLQNDFPKMREGGQIKGRLELF